MRRKWICALVIFLGLGGIPSGSDAAPKGKLVIGTASEPTTLDPHRAVGEPMLVAATLLFDTLIRRDTEGKVLPSLAVSWRLASPKVWEFKLRKGVKFSNGEPVDAQAVKYSVERILDPKTKSRLRSLFKTIKKVEVVDSHTVRLHTKFPDTFLISVLSDWGHIVAPKYYAGNDNKHLSRNPVGSGPYRLVRWKKSQEIVYEANPNYWDPSRNRIKTGVYNFIPETNTRVAALMSGAVQVADHLSPQLVSLVKSDPGNKITSGPSIRTCSILMVLKKGAPWYDKKVRLALNYAVNKDMLLKSVMGGYGQLQQGQIVPSTTYGFNPSLKPYPYDLERAKKLMAEAGYANGFEATMVLPRGRYLKGEDASEAIGGMLKKIGVTIKVNPMEYGAWRRNSRSKWKEGHKPYLGYVCAVDLLAHSAYVYRSIIQSSGTHSGIRDKKLDQLISAARSQTDDASRLKQYQEVNRYIHDEALHVFLYFMGEIAATKKNVEWKVRPSYFAFLTDMSLK